MNIETDVLVVVISGGIAVCVAALSYFQTKRLRFFESFFQRKANAFELYLKVISFIPRTEDELYQLSAISRIVSLYCFQKNKELIDNLLDLMIKAFQLRLKKDIPEPLQEDFRESRRKVIMALRDEMQTSRKFKYE